MNFPGRWMGFAVGLVMVLLAASAAGPVFDSPVKAAQAPAEAGGASVFLMAPEPTALPTPTQMPDNPAEVGWFELGLSVTEGVVFVLILFMLVGIYTVGRKMMRGE